MSEPKRAERYVPPRHVRPRTAEEFRARYDIDDAGCWIWNSTKNSDGYGHWMIGPKYVRAHRWAYETFVGPIPDGLVIGHKCDVKACVNPDHLEAITVGQNNRDALSRGLAVPWNSAAKMTHCLRGHLLPEERNSYGYRVCIECRKVRAAADSESKARNAERNRAYRARKKDRNERDQ